MDKIPYNIDFCRFKECEYLKNDKCKHPKADDEKRGCTWKLKRVKYWERTDTWPWGDV
jgi:hypothetical protein